MTGMCVLDKKASYSMTVLVSSNRNEPEIKKGIWVFLDQVASTSHLVKSSFKAFGLSANAKGKNLPFVDESLS